MLNYPVLYRSMDARLDAAIKAAVDTAIADAEKLWSPEKFDGVFPVKGFGIRKLVAKDLVSNSGTIYGPAQSGWAYSQTTNSTWETFISSGILSDSVYCVITGFFNLDANPDIDAIKITADGVEYPIYHLEEIHGWDIAVAYFSHPIIIRPEKKIHVLAKGRAAGIKTIGFIGYAIGKRSYLIGTL